MITQETLKEYLNYDSETGLFCWVKRPCYNSTARVGDIAGSYDPDGYQRIQMLNRGYRAHRLAFLYMTGHWPKKLVDHINGIRDDNRWVNLREASHSQNCHNLKIAKNNTLGYRGIFKSGNGYVARAMLNKKYQYLGYFKTAQEAFIAYEQFRRKHHGEFFLASPILHTVPSL